MEEKRLGKYSLSPNLNLLKQCMVYWTISCLFLNKSRIPNRYFHFLNVFVRLCLSKTSKQKG